MSKLDILYSNLLYLTVAGVISWLTGYDSFQWQFWLFYIPAGILIAAFRELYAEWKKMKSRFAQLT